MNSYVNKFGFEYLGFYYDLFNGNQKASVEDFIIQNKKEVEITGSKGYAFLYNSGIFNGEMFDIVINNKMSEGIISKLKIVGDADDTIKFTIGVYTEVGNPSAGEEFYFYATYIGLSKNIYNNANTLNTTRLTFFRHSRYLKNTSRVIVVEGNTPIITNYEYTYPLQYSSNDNSIPASIHEIKKTSIHEAFVELQVYGGYSSFKVGVGGFLSSTQRNGYQCNKDLTGQTVKFVTLNTFAPTKKITVTTPIAGNPTIEDISEDRAYEYSTYFSIKKPSEFLYFNNVAKAVLILIEQFDEV